MFQKPVYSEEFIWGNVPMRYTSALMAVNLRCGGAVERAGNCCGIFIAGNLESALTINAPDRRVSEGRRDVMLHLVNTANFIRKILDLYRAVHCVTDPLQHQQNQSFLEASRSGQIFVSNWAGVTRRIVLWNCRQALHLPLLDPTAGQRATAIVEAEVDGETGDGAFQIGIIARESVFPAEWINSPTNIWGRKGGGTD